MEEAVLAASKLGHAVQVKMGEDTYVTVEATVDLHPIQGVFEAVDGKAEIFVEVTPKAPSVDVKYLLSKLGSLIEDAGLATYVGPERTTEGGRFQGRGAKSGKFQRRTKIPKVEIPKIKGRRTKIDESETERANH